MPRELLAQLGAWAVDRAGKLTSAREAVVHALLAGLLYLAIEAADPLVQLGFAALASLVVVVFVWSLTVRPSHRPRPEAPADDP